MKSVTTYILWIVYICLLLVLLPHTAWAFQSMEAPGTKVTHWVAAIAFEAAIAVLTHKLAKHIEQTPKGRRGWSRFTHRYVNAFSFGLLIATLVSALANLAHAVEFGQALVIFTEWGIPQGLYSVAFGGVLPLVSLVFARVLSNVVDSEDAPNPEMEQANTTIRELRRKFAESEQHRRAAEERVNTLANDTEQQVNTIKAEAEQRVKGIEAATEARIQIAEDRAKIAEERFGAAGDLMALLFSENKRERIIAVKQWRPQLSGNAIAVIAETTPSYVSEVLNSTEAIDVTAEYTQVKQ